MKKSDIYGIVGSALFCGIILLLLFLIMMPGAKQPDDEGIVVSFGDSFQGGGSVPATTVQAPSTSQPVSRPVENTTTQPTTTSTPEDILTQEDNSLEIARREEDRKKKEQQEQERKKREEEQRRLAEERRQEEEKRLAEQRRQEEQRKREQEAIERANALGNAFGVNDNESGSGQGTGNEQQGNPAGKGSSDGNSWSLDGRALVGRLVSPAYNQDVEGVITVSIRVNERGEVVSTSISTPTTISNAETRKATLEAAKKTKFTPGKNMVTGTITYNFKLR